MTIEITHDFQSAIADDPAAAAAGEVTPSHWNEAHVITQAEGSLLGRVDSGVGPTTELSPAQVRTLINVADGSQPFFHSTFENVTTNNVTTTEANPDVFISFVTTDGNGQNNMTFPAASDPAATLGSRYHLVILQTQTGPTDSVNMISGGAEVEGATLVGVGDFALYFNGAKNDWSIVATSVASGERAIWTRSSSGAMVMDSVTSLYTNVSTSNWQFFASEDDGTASFRDRDPNDIKTYYFLDFANETSIDNDRYVNYLQSRNEAGAQEFTCDLVGDKELSGWRGVLQYDTQNHPSAFLSLSPSNFIVASGDQPTAIMFYQEGDQLLREFQGWRDGNNGKWMIIGASDGTVYTGPVGAISIIDDDDTFALEGTVA